jgi:hypothetical protein
MPDLQQVDRTEATAADERGLDRGLGVAGEECAEPTVPQEHHHRPVVDVALGQRARCIGFVGIDDLERG